MLLDDYVNVFARKNQAYLETNLKNIHRLVHSLRRKAPADRLRFAHYVEQYRAIWYILQNAWHLEKGFQCLRVPKILQERFYQDRAFLEYCVDVIALKNTDHPLAACFFTQQYDTLTTDGISVEPHIFSIILHREIDQRTTLLAHLDMEDVQLPFYPEESWDAPFSIYTSNIHHLDALEHPLIHNKAHPELYMSEWSDERIELFMDKLQHLDRYFRHFIMSEWPTLLFEQLNENQKAQYCSIMQANLWTHQRSLPPISFLTILMKQLTYHTTDILDLLRYALHGDTKKGIQRRLMKDPFWADIFNGIYDTQLDLLSDIKINYTQLQVWIKNGVLPYCDNTPTAEEVTLY